MRLVSLRILQGLHGGYLEVRCTYNLLSSCTYNPYFHRVPVVVGLLIGLYLQDLGRL